MTRSAPPSVITSPLKAPVTWDLPSCLSACLGNMERVLIQTAEQTGMLPPPFPQPRHSEVYSN